jgi:hypothetical protein
MWLMSWLRRIPRLRQQRTDAVAPEINHLERVTEETRRRLEDLEPLWDPQTLRVRRNH